MGQLTNLRELILSANDLRVLPDSMRGLVGLGRLDVESDQLCDLPIWLADLKHLSVLYLGSPLGSNPFIALPAVIHNLKQLQRLYVTSCDSIPSPTGWVGGGGSRIYRCFSWKETGLRTCRHRSVG